MVATHDLPEFRGMTERMAREMRESVNRWHLAFLDLHEAMVRSDPVMRERLRRTTLKEIAKAKSRLGKEGP